MTTPTYAATLSSQELARAIEAAETGLRCARTRGAFLDRQFARGDWSWTQARAQAFFCTSLEVLNNERASRAARAA